MRMAKYLQLGIILVLYILLPMPLQNKMGVLNVYTHRLLPAYQNAKVND